MQIMRLVFNDRINQIIRYLISKKNEPSQNKYFPGTILPNHRNIWILH